MNRKMIWAEVISQEKIADDIYDLKLLAPDAAAEAVPGQFVSLFTGDEAHLLPRPISICGADGAEQRTIFSPSPPSVHSSFSLRPSLWAMIWLAASRMLAVER